MYEDINESTVTGPLTFTDALNSNSVHCIGVDRSEAKTRAMPPKIVAEIKTIQLKS